MGRLAYWLVPSAAETESFPNALDVLPVGNI